MQLQTKQRVTIDQNNLCRCHQIVKGITNFHHQFQPRADARDIIGYKNRVNSQLHVWGLIIVVA